MAGLLAPDKGEVYIRGKKRHGLISDEDLSGLRIGLVFQNATLFDSLTVRENVGFLLYENSTMPEEQIEELVTETLAAVGLKGVEDRMPSALSVGMKKRVALARSIIFDISKDAEPEVLLYDEPTAGLDPIASTVIEDLIRSVHLSGQDAVGMPGKVASFVVVTHQHSTIRRAVDRLIFLCEGKIVWEGLTHEFTTSANPIVHQVCIILVQIRINVRRHVAGTGNVADGSLPSMFSLVHPCFGRVQHICLELLAVPTCTSSCS